MYRYEFVRVELKAKFLKKGPAEDYKEIISHYAKEGWRFKQIFAPAIVGYGAAAFYELIFEKEVPKFDEY